MIYGREALQQFREQRANAGQEPERQASILVQIPADAPMDDATITVWNGERFVAWEKWLATAPIITEERTQEVKAVDRKVARGKGTNPLPQDAAVQKGLW